MEYWEKQGREKQHSGYFGQSYLHRFHFVEEKGKDYSPLSCFLCFGQHLMSTFFLFLSPFSTLSLPCCPCSLPSLSFSKNGYNTGYLQLFIPMALILVLVATQKADFTSDLQTPVGPRSLSHHLLYPWSAGKGSESLRKIHLTEKGIKLLWCEEQCTGFSPP